MTYALYLAMLGTAAVATVANPVSAGTCTWLGITSSWCDAQNWSCGHVPNSGDDAVVPPETPAMSYEPQIDCDTTINSLTVCAGRTVGFRGPYTLTIDDGRLHVKSGGEVVIGWASAKIVAQGTDALDIDGVSANLEPAPGRIKLNAANVALELTGASSSGCSVDGELLLLNASARLKINNDVKVVGCGKIEGSHGTADIFIASEATFTSQLGAIAGGIRGFMRIAGGGHFTNDGLIFAGTGGTFELASGLSGVSGSGDWRVASSGTRKLLFSVPATSLTGDFVLAGELELAEDVRTCGQLTFNTGALIDVETVGSSFKYLAFNANSTCSNPKDSGGGTDCATDPYVVSTNKLCN